MADAKHNAQFPPGIHEALASLADGDVLAGLEGIVAALRPQRGLAPNAGIAALCHLLESCPAYRTALREVLRRYLGDGSAAGFYAENGILANTGFFTELGRRVVGKMLPPPRDDSLRGVIGVLFDSGEHVAWLEEMPAGDWHALYDALHLEEDTATSWQQPWLAMLDGLDMLSVRMAAIGVEPELMRHYRVPRDRHNPFLAQNTELQTWLIEARTALLEGDRPVPDTRQVDVLLDQCAKAADTVRRSARRAGASFGLTFLLQRLEQSLARMRTLLEKPGGYLANDRLPPGVLLDDMPAFEFGALLHVREMTRALRRDFSRSPLNAVEDPDLLRAEPFFNFRHDSWLVPSSEGEYEAGLQRLQAYYARLTEPLTAQSPGARFHARADNLGRWLEDVSLRLDSHAARLGRAVAPAEEGGTPSGLVDDVFHETRGYCWALLVQLRAVQTDFAPVLKERGGQEHLAAIIRELEGTQRPVRSLMILNGSEYGVLANHSLVLAGYVARANAGVLMLRQVLNRN